jgi:hypothetical protein
MRRVLLVVSICAMVGLLAAGPARAAGTSFTASVKIPIDLTVFVPCANGGAGEFVTLSGNLHDLFHVTFDGSGGLTIKFLDNPQGVSGVGETTGAVYHGTGQTQETFHFSGVSDSFSDTFVNVFHIVGTGPGNDFFVREVFHVTVNANGTLTAFVDQFSVTCG